MSSLRSLGSQLKRLRLEELKIRSARKRLIKEREKQRWSSSSSNQNSSSNSNNNNSSNTDPYRNDASLISHLPTNRGLEASIALLFSRGNGSRDPRVFLDVTQRLLGCTVLSLAANTTGKWDPMDIKPQVFALGKHMALPIFTSIRAMREFCWRHDFSVRGPDGASWAQSGCAPPDAFQLSEPEKKGDGKKKGSAGDHEQQNKSGKPKTKKQLRREAQEKSERRRLSRQNQEFKKLLDSASKVQQFEMKTVTPLHTWGAPHPPYFFHGYYGLLTTVLENASVLPGETDIVVNPTTPLELALSHGLTTKHLSRNAAEYLVHEAFQRVEKEIRKEFADFLSRYCPEVITARSGTIRKSLGFSNDDEDGRHHQFSNDVQTNADMDFLNQNNLSTTVSPDLLRPDAFDLVVLLETRNFEKTSMSVQQAKSFGLLVGHVSLRVLPLEDAPAHVVEMCETFYSGQEERDRKRSIRQLEKGDEYTEGLEVMGESVIVNSHVSSRSVYNDPNMAYTESHAMALKKYK